MIQAIETTLRKLEAARRPPEGAFFLAWGRGEQDVGEVVAHARRGAIHFVLRAPARVRVTSASWL